MSSNGQLTNAELAPIGNGFYLRRDAAAAFNAMSADARQRWGRPITVISAYRSYAKQVALWNLYLSGHGNLAARPGTSNHGWGLAVDLTPQWSRWAVDQIGARYGFAKRCSDAASEWWHVVFNPSCTHAGPLPKAAAAGPRSLSKGMRGKDVQEVQTYLQRGGYLPHAKKGQKPVLDGIFGESTRQAVLRFQRGNHITADGVVGPKTIAALRNKYRVKAKPKPRVLRKGMKGKDVQEVQTYLQRGNYLPHAKKGQKPVLDGIFGESTRQAVLRFQRGNKLTADGQVGPATIAALRRKYKLKKK